MTNCYRNFCAICVLFVSLFLGVIYSGLLVRSGALQWIDTWNPAGRGLRFHGETPWLVPKPWIFAPEKIPDLSGQVILVTGANAGLGYWTAVLLARANASIVLACRSPRRCAEAAESIEKDVEMKAGKKAFVSAMTLDLSSFESIRAFAADFKAKYSSLDSLVLNAGVMLPPFQLTTDGLELTMGTNHFGHFLLTMLLIPTLEAAAKGPRGVATVSVHSSAVIFESKPEEGLTKQLLSPVAEPASNSTWYDAFGAYVQSKLANVLFAQELADRLRNRNILVNSHAPGAVRTNLLSHILGLVEADGPVFGGGGKIEETIGAWGRYLLLKYILPVHNIVWDPEDASLTQVYTAVSPELKAQRITGKYFQSVARMVEPDPHCRNDTLQALLWAQSEFVTSATVPAP